MIRFATVALALCAGSLLAGCAGNMQLLEDGKVHQGSWNALSKQVEATIDGTKYTGTFTQNVSVGFGTGMSGNRFATGTAFATNGERMAVLTSPDGKVIQCAFTAVMGRGQGQCEGMDGRRFVMVIGG